MRRMIVIAGLLLASVPAHARTYHYTCTKGDDHYALTVNEDRRVVKVIKRAPTEPVATFRILRVSSHCAKYGWDLSGGARFCTATQGVGDCDQADTE